MNSNIASSSASAGQTPHPAANLRIYSVKESWVLPKLDPATDMKALGAHIREFRNRKGSRAVRGVDKYQRKIDYILGRTSVYVSDDEADEEEDGLGEVQEDSQDSEEGGEQESGSRKRKGKARAAKSAKKVAPTSAGETAETVAPVVDEWWRVQDEEAMQIALESAIDEHPAMLALLPVVELSLSTSRSTLFGITWEDSSGQKTATEGAVDEDLLGALEKAPTAAQEKVLVQGLRDWLAIKHAKGSTNAQRILQWMCFKHLSPDGSKLLIHEDTRQELSDQLALFACRLLRDSVRQSITSNGKALQQILRPYKPQFNLSKATKATSALSGGVQMRAGTSGPAYGPKYPQDRLKNWIVPTPVVSASELASMTEQSEVRVRVEPALKKYIDSTDIRESYHLDLLQYAILSLPNDAQIGNKAAVSLAINRTIAVKTGKQHIPATMLKPFTVQKVRDLWRIVTHVHQSYVPGSVSSVRLRTPGYATLEDAETEVALGMQMLLDVITTDLHTDLVLLKVRIFDHLLSRAVNSNLRGPPEVYEELKQSIGGICKHPNNDGWHFCSTGHFISCVEHLNANPRCKSCVKVHRSTLLKTEHPMDYDKVYQLLKQLKKEDKRYEKKDVNWLAKVLDRKDDKDIFIGTKVKSQPQIVADSNA